MKKQINTLMVTAILSAASTGWAGIAFVDNGGGKLHRLLIARRRHSRLSGSGIAYSLNFNNASYSQITDMVPEPHH